MPFPLLTLVSGQEGFVIFMDGVAAVHYGRLMVREIPTNTGLKIMKTVR